MDALCIAATDGDDLLAAFETNDTVDGLAGNDTIYGYEGQDTLAGSEGNDTIYGGEDNDTLNGGPGDDLLNGGSGDDLLLARSGNDEVLGGSGNDNLYGEAGNDTLTGDSGNDRFFFAPGYGQDIITDMRGEAYNMDMIYLTGGLAVADVTISRSANTLRLTLTATGDLLIVTDYFLLAENPDYPDQAGKIYFDSGETLSINQVKTIVANSNTVTEGDDELFGGVSDDTINGLGGNDRIYGDSGIDTLYGGDGDDTLEGGDDNDFLYGDAGIDSLNGGSGDDELHGGTGNDTLIGEDGNDVLYGEEDNDILNGGNGDDILYGGDGDDTLDGQEGNDQLYGGGGVDNLLGGYDNDTLYGEAGADILDGSYGNDILSGGDDNDTLYGGYDNDHLIGGPGDDVLYGDYGEDILEGGDGNDTLWASSDTEFEDYLNEMSGNRGDDILYGSYGSETYYYDPGDGRDRINDAPNGFGYYESQPDTLIFGAGIAATDLILIRQEKDLIIEFNGTPGAGITIENWFLYASSPLYKIEAFVFADQTEWSVEDIESRIIYYGTEEDDILLGTDTYDDHILGLAGEDYIDGKAGNDILSGGTENDTIRGGDGDDVLDGGEDNDFINGDAGDDELTGGEGNDQLNGGTGNDFLTGGAGNDKYVIGEDSGIDQIDNSGGGTDWILFSENLTADRLSFERQDDDLVILIDGGAVNQVIVLGWFVDPDNRVDYVQPYGGMGITADQIDQMIDPGGGDDGIEVPDESTFDALRYGTENGEQLLGTTGDDLIRGYGGNDNIFAFEGDDWLLGGEGDDYLDGGSGDDVLYGAAGDDTYVFSPGYGHEIIYNQDGGVDWLLFTDTLTIDVLAFERVGDDLLITTDNPGDTVTVIDWFLSTDYKLEYIQPAGGNGMMPAEIEALIPGSGTGGGSEGEDLIPDESTFDTVVNGTVGNDSLMGTFGKNLIWGMEGDDQLFGLGGDDWLSGGDGGDYLGGGPGNDGLLGGPGNDQLAGNEGNDFLRAGSGDDYYIFAPGFGNDTIDNQDGGVDWIIFNDTLTIDVIEFYQENDDLLIKIVGASDQITVLNWFLGETYQVDYVMPAGGYGLTPTQVNQMLENGGGGGTVGEGEELIPDESTFDSVLNGTDASEQVMGTFGKDLLKGYDGDDNLFGLNGDDWLSGGNGEDFLSGGNGNDGMLGGPDDDTLGGDPGDDFMRGGSGNDYYLYSPGAGVDTIDNQDGGMDWIIFTDDLSEERLSFLRNGDDLVIQVDQDPASQVIVTNWFLGDTYQVDYVMPAGGYGIPAATITQIANSP